MAWETLANVVLLHTDAWKLLFKSCAFSLVLLGGGAVGGVVVQSKSLCQSFLKENIHTYWAPHRFRGEVDYLFIVVN